MAKNYDFTIHAHPSIYDPKPRELSIYFSEPDRGLNEQTGVLLLIAGFSGHSNSNVFKKMRQNFADQYNLITVQCDYFGWEFMQTPDLIDVDKNDLQNYSAEDIQYIFQGDDGNVISRLLRMKPKYHFLPRIYGQLAEDTSNFNDLSLMQAIDNISAVIAVLSILEDNSYNIDTNRIMLYGFSQGAYLAYLCNAFAPNLFSLMIDNSSWLFPNYFYDDRVLRANEKIEITIKYLAQSIDFDTELLTLNNLYNKFENHCNILSYHGTSDDLIPLRNKRLFAENIPYMKLNSIGQSSIDNIVFSSTSHGLGADFLKLFELAMKDETSFTRTSPFSIENVSYTTRKATYDFDYSKGLPILTVTKQE